MRGPHFTTAEIWTFYRRKYARSRFESSSCVVVLPAVRNLTDRLLRTSELLAGLPLTDGNIRRFGSFFSKALRTTLRRDKLSQRLPCLVMDTQTTCRQLWAAKPASAHPEWRVMDLFDGTFVTPATYYSFVLAFFFSSCFWLVYISFFSFAPRRENQTRRYVSRT